MGSSEFTLKDSLPNPFEPQFLHLQSRINDANPRDWWSSGENVDKCPLVQCVSLRSTSSYGLSDLTSTLSLTRPVKAPALQPAGLLVFLKSLSRCHLHFEVYLEFLWTSVESLHVSGFPLEQWLSTILTLRPFNPVPHVVVTPNH